MSVSAKSKQRKSKTPANRKHSSSGRKANALEEREILHAQKLESTPENLRRALFETLRESELPVMAIYMADSKAYKKLLAYGKPITWSVSLCARVGNSRKMLVEASRKLVTYVPD
jgi:hypothetical protein